MCTHLLAHRRWNVRGVQSKQCWRTRKAITAYAGSGAYDKIFAPLVEEARQSPQISFTQQHAQHSAPNRRPVTSPRNKRFHQNHSEAAVGADIHPSITNLSGPDPMSGLGLYSPCIVVMPSRKIRPSQMEFETMFMQLAAWKQQYLTAHVPRFCFDAPELGAWVRHMRKQHKDCQLAQWKTDRLNELSFEWKLTDADAKWHHLYHQLRRYKLLYGTTNINPRNSSKDACDWVSVSKWLQRQGRLLAKQKLNGQKRVMLEQLGVTLRLPKQLLYRTAQLQALNGPERRKLRKRWKKLDAAATEKRWEQQQLQQEQRLELLQRDEAMKHRRLVLLQDAQQGAAVTAGLFDDAATQFSSGWAETSIDGQKQRQAGQFQRQAEAPAQQEQQQQDHQWQEQLQGLSLSLLPSQDQQQQLPQQQQSSNRLYDHQRSAELPCSSMGLDSESVEGSSNNIASRESLWHLQAQQDSREVTFSSGAVPVPAVDHQQQQSLPAAEPVADAGLVGEQQQPQHPEALLYDKNRRRWRRQQRSRQERWLLAEQQLKALHQQWMP